MITYERIHRYMCSLRYAKLRRQALEPPIVKYIIRPRDGIQYGYALPVRDVSGTNLAWTCHEMLEGTIFIAVCDFCGGNCGQCGTSIGEGVPFNFDLMAKNGKWDKPGWGGR